MITHHEDATASPLEARRTFPLHDAVRAHDLRRVKQLLRGGADPTAADAQGLRPLEVLVIQRRYRNDVAVATALLDASPASDRFGNALALAAACRRTHLVDVFLRAGHPTDRCEEALFTAVRSEDEGVSQMLITFAGVVPRDEWARSPLHYARTPSMVDLLIAAGADPNAVDCDGKTPLHLTRRGTVAKALLAHGARVDARDATGSTPLHCADSVRLVRILLRAGADPRKKNRDGQSIAGILGGRALSRDRALGEVLRWAPDYLADALEAMPSPDAKDNLIRAVRALPPPIAARLADQDVARMLADPYPPLRRAGLSLLAARASEEFPGGPQLQG